MRSSIRPFVTGLFVLVSAMVTGCAQIPPCTVSPIEIEETREGVKLLEKDLVQARAKAQELSDELARKQAEFESKKDKPEELRKKLEELKKGSGRFERDKDEKDDEEATT